MHIKRLSLINFKNYEEAELELSPAVNCFVGDNGSGKTNILDAIHYLSVCKSYFNPIDSQNVRHEEGFFVLQADVSVEDETDRVHCGVKKGEKNTFKRNDKEYSRLADHIGRFPSVIITPNDTDLIREGSEVRRKFIDGIISQLNRSYLDNLIKYNKVLLQRNNLLKHFAAERRFDAENLAIWTDKLVELGIPIEQERRAFMERFTPIFSTFYQKISGGVEEGGLRYKSNFSPEEFASELLAAQDKDCALQRTTIGPHKDDVVFLLGDHPVKKLGSQGQQKSFLIALKLAQFQFVKEAKGVMPWLLLDDVFDKIDDKRVAYLMELVSENQFGQIFITDTHKVRVPDLFKAANKEVRVFEVEKGKITSNQKEAV